MSFSRQLQLFYPPIRCILDSVGRTPFKPASNASKKSEYGRDKTSFGYRNKNELIKNVIFSFDYLIDSMVDYHLLTYLFFQWSDGRLKSPLSFYSSATSIIQCTLLVQVSGQRRLFYYSPSWREILWVGLDLEPHLLIEYRVTSFRFRQSRANPSGHFKYVLYVFQILLQVYSLYSLMLTPIARQRSITRRKRSLLIFH